MVENMNNIMKHGKRAMHNKLHHAMPAIATETVPEGGSYEVGPYTYTKDTNVWDKDGNVVGGEFYP